MWLFGSAEACNGGLSRKLCWEQLPYNWYFFNKIKITESGKKKKKMKKKEKDKKKRNKK